MYLLWRASGSTSADYAGIGLYDTKEKVHIDFTDIYGAGEGTYGKEGRFSCITCK